MSQQVTQQFVPPMQTKKEKKDKIEKEKSEKEAPIKKNSNKKTRYDLLFLKWVETFIFVLCRMIM